MMRVPGNSSGIESRMSVPFVPGAVGPVQGDVRPATPELRHSLRGVDRLRHQKHVGLGFDARAQAFPEDRMVVDAQDADSRLLRHGAYPESGYLLHASPETG